MQIALTPSPGLYQGLAYSSELASITSVTHAHSINIGYIFFRLNAPLQSQQLQVYILLIIGFSSLGY